VSSINHLEGGIDMTPNTKLNIENSSIMFDPILS